MEPFALPQALPVSPYARLKAAWDRRLPYTEAIRIWRRLSGSPLLTAPDANSKLAKGKGRGWSTLSLSLAPADMSGINVCPCSTQECRMSCIGHSAGNARRYPAVVESRIMRTKFLFKYPEAAMSIIEHELHKWSVKLGKRAKKAVRFNAFSDIAWEVLNPGMIEYAQSLGFRVYDYTKIAARLARPVEGYDLTLSYSGENWHECLDVLKSGGRVSMVFAGWFPTEFRGFTVVDGDAHDLRFLDPKGCIVGLKLKGVKPETAGSFAVKEECMHSA